MTAPRKLTPHDERRVAVAAGCDPRTVRSVIAGKPAHSTTTARVHEALRSLGLAKANDAEPPPREGKAR